jgi:flavin-dependent dehydrogenase
MTHSAATQVVILGGGLAGLSLAIQLRREIGDIDVLVLERRRHPVPEAAHKVGESTVEIGANYFATVLGLEEHLMQRQLKKFGFRFFFSDGRSDVDATLELGASRFLPTPSYQIDRGIFENFLGEHARSLGIRFVDGAVVRTIEMAAAEGLHRIEYEVDGARQTAQARWLIDASGRAGLLKRKLGLAEQNDHDANAVWFRIEGKIDVNEWSQNVAWRERCTPPNRWLSTNHLCGEGYWVWLIPLASGSHSVGIVCDARLHPLETMNTFDTALDWLRVHQPRLAVEVESKRDRLQDFVFLRKFSYGCKQVFSAERWALTGEAGVFLDPFYSPGSDFIGISNTYIADIIARDLKGELINARAHVYQQLYFSFYESTLALYQDQYAMFGDPNVFPTKVIWDYTYYWGILCQLFFQRRLTDITNIARLSDDLNHCKQLNYAMQRVLRVWSQRGPKENREAMLDQASLPWFAELNRSLQDCLSEEEFRSRIKENTVLLNVLAHQIVERARVDCPELDASEVEQLVGRRMGEHQSLLFAL